MDILKYEKSFQSQGYKNIVGIDEAGRGPLAGPVVAVALNWGDNEIIDGIRDSKKISEKKRLTLFKSITKQAFDIGIGIVHENDIDRINILQSTYLAMRKAIGSLKVQPDLILVDGNRADIKHVKQKNIIKGDSLSYSIACASIIAKVTRDLMMIQYSKIFPKYGFEKHKGYGTKFHIQMIQTFFSCPIHRKSFNPVSNHLPSLKYYDNQKLQVLGTQIAASFMIKKGFNVILFKDTYDLVVSDKKILVILSVRILINKKTIDSKSPLNSINFDQEIRNFLVALNLNHFKYFRIDSVDVVFLKEGPKINIKEGKLYES